MQYHSNDAAAVQAALACSVSEYEVLVFAYSVMQLTVLSCGIWINFFAIAVLKTFPVVDFQLPALPFHTCDRKHTWLTCISSWLED